MQTVIRRAPCGDRDREALPVLILDAEARERARQVVPLPDGQSLVLQLPRGTVLAPDDVLLNAAGTALALVEAKIESVYTLRAEDILHLLRAAYHLGNRHIAMEVQPDYLRIKPDPVLAHLVAHLGGVHLIEEMAPFVPEGGAYSGHGHTHG
ncbi:urease accessory protein UreE [Acidithiobacillus sp. M4-SHS-6]|uniref:urease accessory protein UreE n=1 Tax=Acidithiobacillus sp. M4-SHS-6 TaxID=3383024 RepID=UPI0039BEC14B